MQVGSSSYVIPSAISRVLSLSVELESAETLVLLLVRTTVLTMARIAAMARKPTPRIMASFALYGW